MKASTYIAIAVLSALATASAAQPERNSLAASTAEHQSASDRLRSRLYDNPAMQQWRWASALNTLGAGYDGSRASRPVRPEYGESHNRLSGSIDAYLRKGKTTLWGAASYSNGRTNNVMFCETSDFETVAPYVMADTVGGDNHSERYHFMGGFALPLGRFSIGAQASYTALMEYRTRDPRPKNLSGDLRASVGMTWSPDGRRLIGIAASARKYKQTNEVEIYNEVTMPLIYHLTGLGTDYYRFRGANTSTYYKGYGAGLTATFARRDRLGAFAAYTFRLTDIDKIISSLNQLPMTRLLEYDNTLDIGYTAEWGKDRLTMAAAGALVSRRGTENIFGTAQDNIYPQIAKARQYTLRRTQAGIRSVWERHPTATDGFAVGLDAFYRRYKESYSEPHRSIEAGTFSLAMNMQGHIAAGPWLFSAKAAVSPEWSTDCSSDMPQSDDKMAIPTTFYYEYLRSSRLNTEAQIEAAVDAGRFMPFVRMGWRYSRYARGEHTTWFEATAGIRF